MKMKDQLDSAQPMKKHKAKSKKADLKKKKQAKLEAKKQSKEKKQANVAPLPTPVVTAKETPEIQKPITAKTRTSATTPSIADTTPSIADTIPSMSNTPDAQTVRTRASKSLTPMTKVQQRVAINKIIKSLILDEITQGAALRELRVSVLGLRQEAYTELTGVSRKTLSEIENGKGNYTPEILNKVFAPFDLKIGLVPTSSSTLKTLLR
jgi:DNA-binding XRE family transcriptional regulator